jgi:hypothetical protein
MVISPWARPGFIDSQTLSYDAYLKLIEDRFLGGQRLDPELHHLFGGDVEGHRHRRAPRAGTRRRVARISR